MHVTFDQLDFSRGESRYVRTSPPIALPTRTSAPDPAPAVEWQPGGGYGTRRPRAPMIAAIALFHAGLIVALVTLDVVPMRKAAPAPLVVTLMPEQIAPPPEASAPPKPEIAPVRPAPTQIVAPPPVVVVPVAAPVQVATVAAPAPAPVVAAAVPSAAAAPAPAPAPISPPDAFAGSLDNPAPRYPVESRRRREEGTVRLRVVVTADGRVKEIGVARSSGFDRLDDAALDAVRKWRFRPGMQAGTPVEALGFVSIPFKLQA